MLASDPMVAVLPVPLTSGVLRMASREARVSVGEAHADGVGAVVDHHRRGGRLALQDGAGVQFHFLAARSRRARSTAGSTLKTLAGPLMVFSMPFSTSTTPGIFLMASPTAVAHCAQQVGILRRTA